MAARVRPDDWVPGVWSHAALMDLQTRLDPVRMLQYADDWQRAVDAMRDVLVALSRQVAAQLDRSWQGQGADASTAALRRYVAGSIDGFLMCRSVAVHLSELSRAAGDLRASALVDQHLEDALAQVRQLYSGPAVAAGNAVADIPAPPEPFAVSGQAAAVPPAAATQTATSPAAVAPFDSTPSQPLGARAAAPSDMPLPVAEPQPRWQVPTHSATVSSSPGDALSARPEPLSTTPGPASTSAPATVPGQAPGVAPRAATQPISPYFGAAYPGYGGRGEGTERRAPRYLISAGYTNELIGELPPVAPPVIGE